MKIKGSVLVVDDNSEMLETICWMVRSMGVGDVSGYTNAGDVRTLMKEDNNVELIVCDWNMPEMSGLELLKGLRQEGSLIPFVMVTARNDMQSVLEARKYGVNLYVSKPFSLSELNRKITWVMNNSTVGLDNFNFADELN